MIIGYVLLALGVAVFVISFLLPVKTEDEKAIEFSEDMIRELVNKEVSSAKDQINDIVDETVNYAMEKTERSMDRITNEKMMAVNEYSDTVLSEINKNHQEVVFLYDMLNDKHENLKNTVSEVEKTASEVKQAVKDAELTAKETKEQVLEAKETSFKAFNFEPERITEEEKERVIEPVERMSAIDRLKMVTAEEAKNAVPDGEIEKKPRKKRTTKPKVREEAVVLGDAASLSMGSGSNNFEVITKDTDTDLGEAKSVSEGPNLNLGEASVGRGGARNNNEKILELHNAGKSNMAIAKELGLGIGEVKLVIDLFEGI